MNCGLFADEQKGYRKVSRGAGELFYIDQHILNKSKRRRKNLAMTWIDYKKVYDPIYQPLRSGRIWHKVNF